jgi:F420-dependent oxidoreductase-like protein
VEICLMIEGQEGVTWDDWLALASACEEHGLEGLFTSDHYRSFHGGGGLGAFDAWTVLSALAARTETIRLGTLVSPVTFRHPSVLAKAALTVDHVSGGRIEVGMGAGWNEDEHRAYGIPFPPLGERMAMLAEQLRIVHETWTEETLVHEGEHYRVGGTPGEPKPFQQPHPPLIVGGRGGPRSLDLAARWADEYDLFDADPEDFVRVRPLLAEACQRHRRDPADVRLSWMGRVPERGDELVERLRRYADAGVERAYLQHLEHRDLDAVADFGRHVAPALRRA